jgi:hypothetical protein
MSFVAILFIILGLIIYGGIMFAVGRNNPSIPVVNSLIAKGDVVVKTLADGVVGLEKFGTKVGAAASAAKKSL